MRKNTEARHSEPTVCSRGGRRKDGGGLGGVAHCPSCPIPLLAASAAASAVSELLNLVISVVLGGRAGRGFRR